MDFRVDTRQRCDSGLHRHEAIGIAFEDLGFLNTGPGTLDCHFAPPHDGCTEHQLQLSRLRGSRPVLSVLLELYARAARGFYGDFLNASVGFAEGGISEALN